MTPQQSCTESPVGQDIFEKVRFVDDDCSEDGFDAALPQKPRSTLGSSLICEAKVEAVFLALVGPVRETVIK